MNLEYPLAWVHSKNNRANFVARFIGKGTADLPAFGTTTETWAGSLSAGIKVYADVSSENNDFRFFASGIVNEIVGTDMHHRNLGIPNQGFLFGNGTLGVVIAGNIRISLIVSTFSSVPSPRNRNVIAGGQILR